MTWKKTEDIIKSILPASTLRLIRKKIMPTSAYQWVCGRLCALQFYQHRREIAHIMTMLSDDLSRDTLKAYLSLCCRGGGGTVSREQVVRPYNKQYFDETVLMPLKGGVFVDMGVLDGATSIQFVEWVDNDYNGIILFEPDAQSYECSKNNISHLSNTIIYNEATSDFCGEIYFDTRHSGSSRVSEVKTGSAVKATTLDSKLPELPFTPTYIKMDIEGSELAALRGCVETIQKFKPALAICIYHKLNDIWEIPTWIHQINPDYKLYIRHYDVSVLQLDQPKERLYRYELVCYAL